MTTYRVGDSAQRFYPIGSSAAQIHGTDWSVTTALGYLAGLLLLSLVACSRPLSNVTIVPPRAAAPDQVSRDYTECRQQAQESSTAYIPAGDMFAAVRRVRTNDNQFLDCLKMNGYSVISAQGDLPLAPHEPSSLSQGLPEPTLQRTIYDVVLAGKSCRALPEQSIECRYEIGKDLRFVIARVREAEAAISSIHSDHLGDFYADLGLFPICIRIVRGLPSPGTASTTHTGGATDHAFVSIRTGIIYRNAEDCQKHL